MFEMSIAFRHVSSHRRQTFFSVIAVALSVAIIIVFISMINGFMENIIDTTVENQAHITVFPKENEDEIYLYHGLEDYLTQQEGVIAVSSYYKGEAALQYRHNVEGIVLSGIVPENEDRVLNMEKDMVAGELESLIIPGNNIILGSKLAQNLEVDIGDTVTAQVPGSSPTDFKITGIIRTGTPADEISAYGNLERVQDLYNAGDIITGTGIRISDIYLAQTLANTIDRQTDYDAVSWIELNSEILTLINTQQQFGVIFYIMIFAISGFSIANILSMIVMEKVGEIGMLLAMGTTRRSILFIFLLEAGILGMIGVLVGCVIGYIFCLVIVSITIPVPPEMYFGMDHLPLLITPQSFIIAGGFSMIINLIAGIQPARKASKMDPVEAIHSV
jgi:ABC-type lipoprotein release transport system permease subunit